MATILSSAGYNNQVIEDTFESNLITKLDFSTFAKLDNSLVASEGLTKVINKYTASNTVETLEEGEGNSVQGSISYASSTYTVACLQGQFSITDEAVMKDANLLDGSLDDLAVRFTNKITTDVISEMGNGTATVSASSLSYDAVVDAIATLPYEEENDLYILTDKEGLAELRKDAKDSIQYVEGIYRTGYVGSVAGVPIYMSKATLPTDTKAVVGKRDAITIFTKKGVESETERDGDTRTTTYIMRKYGLVALTDDTKLVRIVDAE